jgi:hypothetical protein
VSLPDCSSARFALLPFALFVSRVGSCRLAFSITFGCCHLTCDLLLTVAGELWSSPVAQSPELGGMSTLVSLVIPVIPTLLIPTTSLFSVRPLRPAAQAAASKRGVWLCRSGS